MSSRKKGCESSYVRRATPMHSDWYFGICDEHIYLQAIRILFLENLFCVENKSIESQHNILNEVCGCVCLEKRSVSLVDTFLKYYIDYYKILQ